LTKEENKKYKHEYYLKHREKILARTKQYKGNNPEKVNRWTREWAINNPEKTKESRRKSYAKNKEKKKIYAENHRESIRANWQKWEENHYELRKERDRQYREQNREKIKERNRLNPNVQLSNQKKNKRRYEVYQHTNITTEYLRELWDKTNHCCITGIKLENHGRYPNGKHLDHIIPLNAGGTHTKDNVRYISAIANINRPRDGRDEIFKTLLFINIIKKQNAKSK
jgi:hypothetical protein